MGDDVQKRIGDYQILGHVGDGAQGKIFKAECVVDNNPHVPKGGIVALKVVRRFGEDDRSEERFRREVKIFLELKHPNLVEYKEFFTVQDEWSSDIHCLVMEFLEGEDLSSRLRSHSRGLPFESVKGFFEQALDGLCYARENGIIHRDLKPGNVFLLSDGTVKVIDFGIARKEDGTVTTTAGFKGTYDYMAPDFLTAGDNFRGDELSDVFSMGVCFYKALTGQLPYPGSKESGWVSYLNRWQQGNVKDLAIPSGPLRVLNDRALAFVRKTLRSDRNERFNSFSEMLTALKKIERRSIDLEKDRYEFLSYLGKGGFGEVFKARRVSDGKIYAIKHLFPNLDPSRFRREARLLQKYPHPNLVEYAGFKSIERLDGEDHYLVLEFLEGMPQWGLRSRIKSEGGMGLEEILRLFTGYLSAMDFLHTAHRKPILHRDITPANLYAPPQDRETQVRINPKIFDLGIARSEQTMTGGHVPGNPEYMAPEFMSQADFRGSVQSDIYCLGMCLYESVTGNPAYDRLSKQTAEMWNALKERADGKVTISYDYDVFRQNPTLEKITRKAIARNPKKRFDSAAEMLAALQAMGTADEGKGLVVEDDGADDEIVSTAYVPEGEAAAAMAAVRTAQSKSVLRWGIIGLLVLLLAGLGGYMVTRGGGERAAVKHVKAFSKSAYEFAPTSGNVRELRRHVEKAEAYRKEFPANRDIENYLRQLEVAWSGIDKSFDNAFTEHVDKGALGKAEEVLEEWRACDAYLPFKDVRTIEHTSTAMSMGKRLEFCRGKEKLKTATPGLSQEYLEALVSLLKAARENERIEVLPAVRPWWVRQKSWLMLTSRGLPDSIKRRFGKAIKEEDLAEAEVMARAWVASETLAGVSEVLPLDKREGISVYIARAAERLIEERRALGVSAYAGGELREGDSTDAWMRKCETKAPTLIGFVRKNHRQAVRDLVQAQIDHLTRLVAKVPQVVEEPGLKRLELQFNEIRDLYLRWSSRWTAAEADKLRRAATGASIALAEHFSEKAIKLYDEGKYDEGNDAHGMLKKVVGLVPEVFRKEQLNELKSEVAKKYERSQKLDKEMRAALDELDTIARVVAKSPVSEWNRALVKWGKLGLSREARDDLERRQKWQTLSQSMETRLSGQIAGATDAKTLEAVLSVLNLKEGQRILGDETHRRMKTQITMRGEILKAQTTLERIRVSTKGKDPDSLKRGFQDLVLCQSSKSYADKSVYDLWQVTQNVCFDQLKDYAYQAEPSRTRVARIMRSEQILADIKKAGIFDPARVQELDTYIGGEKKRLQAPKVAVPVKPPRTTGPGPIDDPGPVVSVKPPRITDPGPIDDPGPAVTVKPPRITDPGPIDDVGPIDDPGPPPELVSVQPIPVRPVKPPIATTADSLRNMLVSTESLLKQRRVREAAVVMSQDLPRQCLALSRLGTVKIRWDGLLTWIRKQRTDHPLLDLVGRQDLNNLETDLRSLRVGDIPPRLRPAVGRWPGERRPQVQQPRPLVRRPPKEIVLSRPMKDQVAKIEAYVKRKRFREAAKVMADRRVIRRLAKLKKKYKGAISFETYLAWIRQQRRRYPQLDTYAKNDLDLLENALETEVAREMRR